MSSVNATPINEAERRRAQIRENLVHLRSSAELDRSRSGRKEWQSILELTGRQLRRIDDLSSDVPTTALRKVENYFGLATRSLETGAIDFKEIAVRHSKNTELPAPYMVAAFGRRRATISALEHFETKHGWRARRELFRHFRLEEAMFANAMDPISMRFMTEVSTHLVRSWNYSHHDLYEMGANLCASDRGSIVASVFSKCGSAAEVYGRFFGDMMKHFELNCRYTIHELDEDRCVFDCSSRREVAEVLKVRHLGNADLCHFKAGVFSSLTEFLGMPFARIKELNCVHRGDSTCKFELRYERPKAFKLPS